MESKEKSISPNDTKMINSMNDPPWRAALEKYREHIKEARDYDTVMTINSVEHLLKDAEALKSVFKDKSAANFMHRLRSTLLHVDSFSAVLALCFGGDENFASIARGSIRLILTLAPSKEDIISKVITMLEQFGLMFPIIKAYKVTRPVSLSIKEPLTTIYTDVICFYARCIRFFRSNNGFLSWSTAWESLCDDFSVIVHSIKVLTSLIDHEVEFSYVEMNNKKHCEILRDLASLKKRISAMDCDANGIQNLPEFSTPGLWINDDAVTTISKALKPGKKPCVLQSCTLYGIGGVGKTRLVYEFIMLNRRHYQDILWIASDSYKKMSQSFSQIMSLIWPSNGENENQCTSSAILKVKNWLRKTDRNWLLVFDNADDIDVLRHAWPLHSYGSVIITTRNSSAALDFASFDVRVIPFSVESGSKMLLKLVGADSNSKTNQKHAEVIVQAVGGLPLVLRQIISFIRKSRTSLFEFVEEYVEDLLELSMRTEIADDYQHNLNTVWQSSIARLSTDPHSLLHLLCYFQPDTINQSILIRGLKATSDNTFKFMRDKWRRHSAMKELLQHSLIEKSLQNGDISIHCLLQAVVIQIQNNEEQTKLFSVAVLMLSYGFPNTWSEDIGHQYKAWAECEECLPHVHHLISLREKFHIEVWDTQGYGELLLRCGWYLYERECYNTALSLVETALNTFSRKSTLAYASAVDLSGLIMLDLNEPAKALIRFIEAQNIRETTSSPTDSLVASSLNNIGLAYTELGQLDEAYDAHEKAIQIRLTIESDRIGNSYSNMASLLLRLGKADEAEDMLKRCPSLKNFTDETFLNTGNPRFSGDLVLLSRIRHEQGRLSDAIRLSSKALLFRQKSLGNRLKMCDSLYDAAFFTHKQGNISASLTFLTEMVQIAGSFSEGKGQLARAYYKLNIVYSEDGQIGKSETSLEQAMRLRAEVRPELDDEPLTEESFRKLSPWMLW